MLSEPSDLLDELGLAKFFTRDPSTIRRWLKRGALPPCSKFGRRRYWRRDALLPIMSGARSVRVISMPPVPVGVFWLFFVSLLDMINTTLLVSQSASRPRRGYFSNALEWQTFA